MNSFTRRSLLGGFAIATGAGLLAVPPPIARLPMHDLEALGRQDGNDLDARRRRGRRHIYFRLKLGHRWDGQQASSRGDRKAAQQSSANEAVHRAPPCLNTGYATMLERGRFRTAGAAMRSNRVV